MSLAPTRVRMLWALRETELDAASLAALAGCRPTVASNICPSCGSPGWSKGSGTGSGWCIGCVAGMCARC